MSQRLRGYLSIAFIVVSTAFFTIMSFREMSKNPQTHNTLLSKAKKD
jgi:Na+/H+ antiporter NhaC